MRTYGQRDVLPRPGMTIATPRGSSGPAAMYLMSAFARQRRGRAGVRASCAPCQAHGATVGEHEELARLCAGWGNAKAAAGAGQ